jgi:hypothetical protein
MSPVLPTIFMTSLGVSKVGPLREPQLSVESLGRLFFIYIKISDPCGGAHPTDHAPRFEWWVKYEAILEWLA